MHWIGYAEGASIDRAHGVEEDNLGLGCGILKPESLLGACFQRHVDFEDRNVKTAYKTIYAISPTCIDHFQLKCSMQS